MIETCSDVRSFVIGILGEIAHDKGTPLPDLSDDLDLLDAGLIDSMGLVELIAAVEDHLGHEVDLSGRDLDDFTTLGGFVKIMAAH